MLKKFSFLLGLILYSFYIIGVFSTNITGLSLIFIFVFILLIFSKTDFYFNKRAIIFLFFFNLIIIITFLINYKTDYSIYKTQMLLLKFNTLFLIPQLLKKENIFLFTKGLFVLLLFVTLIFFSYSFRSLSSFDYNNRLELGILNPIWISRVCFELVLIYLLFLRQTIFRSVFLLLIIFPIIYASGSKGPVVSFIFSLIFFYFEHKKKSFINIKNIIFLSIVVFGYFYFIQFDNYFVQRFLILTPEANDPNSLQESRAYFIPLILYNFFNSDFSTILFGSGIGNTSKIFYSNYVDDRFYPHNLLVEILCEFGVIIFLILVILVLLFYIRNKSLFKYVFIYYIFNAMFSGDIILNEFIFLYAGLAIAANNQFLNPNFHESSLSDDRELFSRANY